MGRAGPVSRVGAVMVLPWQEGSGASVQFAGAARRTR